MTDTLDIVRGSPLFLPPTRSHDVCRCKAAAVLVLTFEAPDKLKHLEVCGRTEKVFQEASTGPYCLLIVIAKRCPRHPSASEYRYSEAASALWIFSKPSATHPGTWSATGGNLRNRITASGF